MKHTEAGAKLRDLVDRTHELLNRRGEFFTEGAKLAIRDMVEDAQLALEGKRQVPFKRNRQFYAPREEEDILFATERFTMAPTYFIPGKVYHSYGLGPALEWFEKQDVLYEGEEKLQGKADLVLGKARELLASAKPGYNIGEYSREAAEALQHAVTQVEASCTVGDNGEDLARSVVQCFDRIRELRHSRVLRSALDPEATLYLTKAGLRQVIHNAHTDPLLHAQYEQIVKLANTYSLEYTELALELIMQEQANYDKINKHFYVWSSTDKIVNFRAPEGTVKAGLTFILPSEENEQDGLGHVWIDNVEILSASGGSLEILNGGFDEGAEAPLHWRTEAIRGTPVMKRESVYPFCGGGDRLLKHAETENGASSVYICNPTAADEGSWVYENDIPLESGTGYTLTFAAKIDGKLRHGLKAVITFKDDADNSVGQFDYLFNRRSSLAPFLLTMQCDAIQYAFTGERTFALKAKNEILFTLNDFCQGAEHWMATNLRPQGSDAYGAVQGGRVLCSTAVTYSFIKDAQVFTPEEKASFYALIEYLLRYMLDLRDRTELTPEEVQRGSSNWQTDMCAGTAYMMMVLDDFPNRMAWLCNADVVLRAQLELNVNPDFSWPESIRYHHAALERFAGYAKVLKHNSGEDWFESTPLTPMFDYSIQMQTPGYAYFGGRIGTPPFGDHALSGGSEFGSFGTYLGEVERVDKALADRMYHTWVAADKPFKRFWGESIALDHLLGKGDTYEPASEALALQSTDSYKNAGIYIFRKNFGRDNQSYFAIMSSPHKIGHGHLDQGSFILYKNSVPLVMDSGIEGYFDSSTSWHISSYSHACVQFATMQKKFDPTGSGAINLSAGTYSLELGWADVPRTSRVAECTMGRDVESITIEIGNPEGRGRHLRSVAYVKEPDLYIIRDRIEDFDGEVLFSLPVASSGSVIDGSRVYSKGAYGVDLETVFLSKLNRLRLTQGRSTAFFDSGHPKACMMDYIRAVADAKEGFLTVLHPKESAQRPIEVTAVNDQAVRLSWQGRTMEISL